MMRANPAMVSMLGFSSEAELLAYVSGALGSWYVEPGRREAFLSRLRQDGFVRGFISEISRQGDGARMWVSENAHQVPGEHGGVVPRGAAPGAGAAVGDAFAGLSTAPATAG